MLLIMILRFTLSNILLTYSTSLAIVGEERERKLHTRLLFVWLAFWLMDFTLINVNLTYTFLLSR